MTTLEQAARQALETLERASDAGYSVECDETITALREALQQAAATEGYVQPVPDKCDRITWRGRYYHLPLTEQAAPKAAPGEPFDECFPGEPRVAVPQGLISAACFAIRNKRDGGKVLEQLRRYSVGDLSQPLAPKQEAQEPVAWLNPWRADQVTTDYDAYGERGIPLYTAPQPAPAPLSDDVSQKTWALLDELEKLRGANRDEEDWDTLNKRDDELRAALAAQGGKV